MIYMYKIGVIGDRDSILGFSALGLDIFPETDAQRARETLQGMVRDGYAIIYITESLASQLEQELLKYANQKLPAIIPIPAASGNTGIGMRQVKRYVEQAVGSDIIFND